jgi:hypothetical protein
VISKAIFLAVAFLLVNACDVKKASPRSDRPQGAPRTAEAAALVQRFVHADVSGLADSAWALLKGCDVRPVADYLEPTAGTRILDSVAHADTIIVRVLYRVLGRATSTDVKKVGPNNWRFVPGVRSDTLRFSVLADSTGRLWIDCDYFPPIHTAAALMEHAVSHMDGVSQQKWRIALADAARLP